MTTTEADDSLDAGNGRYSACRLRAYYLYLDRERAGEVGDPVGDWLRAEQMEAAVESDQARREDVPIEAGEPRDPLPEGAPPPFALADGRSVPEPVGAP